MMHVKIYGLKESIGPRKKAISSTIHLALMEAMDIPEEQCFQRFIFFEKDCFIYPAYKSSNYTIIEIQTFTGRSDEAKKKVIQTLYRRFSEDRELEEKDIHIIIMDMPAINWGISGRQGNELLIDSKVHI